MNKRKVCFSSTHSVISIDTELGPVFHSKPYPLTKSRTSSLTTSKEYKVTSLRAARINAERCASSDASESVMTLLYKLKSYRPDLWNATGSDSSKEDVLNEILQECINKVEDMQATSL
jgi:hypothetical protein